MKTIGDISLRWQMLLAPLLLILAILAIEAVTYRQQTAVDAATTRLFNETVHRLTELNEADSFALDINGRMFRAMTLVQNGAPPKMVRGLVDSLPNDLDQLGEKMSAVSRRAAESGHAPEAATRACAPGPAWISAEVTSGGNVMNSMASHIDDRGKKSGTLR